MMRIVASAKMINKEYLQKIFRRAIRMAQCPECKGDNYINEGGCWHCLDCGFSLCDK